MSIWGIVTQISDSNDCDGNGSVTADHDGDGDGNNSNSSGEDDGIGSGGDGNDSNSNREYDGAAVVMVMVITLTAMPMVVVKMMGLVAVVVVVVMTVMVLITSLMWSSSAADRSWAGVPQEDGGEQEGCWREDSQETGKEVGVYGIPASNSVHQVLISTANPSLPQHMYRTWNTPHLTQLPTEKGQADRCWPGVNSVRSFWDSCNLKHLLFIYWRETGEKDEGGRGGERERQTKRLLHSFIYLPFLLVLCYCYHCNLM